VILASAPGGIPAGREAIAPLVKISG